MGYRNIPSLISRTESSWCLIVLLKQQQTKLQFVLSKCERENTEFMTVIIPNYTPCLSYTTYFKIFLLEGKESSMREFLTVLFIPF